MTSITPIQIRFSDVDMAHHVHHAAYLHYFELGRMELLRQVVEQDHDWKRNGLILARYEIDYRAPVHLSDKIMVDTRCARLGTKSFELSYALFSGTADARRIHAEGSSVMVCYDYAARQSIPMPSTWRTALARLMASAGPTELDP